MLPIVHHIPVCPFSQRLEILLALKDRRDAISLDGPLVAAGYRLVLNQDIARRKHLHTDMRA